MRLTPSELIAFVEATQGEQWKTVVREKPFTLAVTQSGISINPTGGSPRQISNAEIVKFCSVYGTSSEAERSVYRETFNSSYLRAIASKCDVGRTEVRLPEEFGVEALREGATRTVTVSAFERNPEARRRCIEAHGTSCVVCGFNFGKFYGEYAEGYIHVHHLNPLSVQRDDHEIDPVRDLRPVCPNCHAVIHLRSSCLTIDEAREMIQAVT